MDDGFAQRWFPLGSWCSFTEQASIVESFSGFGVWLGLNERNNVHILSTPEGGVKVAAYAGCPWNNNGPQKPCWA